MQFKLVCCLNKMEIDLVTSFEHEKLVILFETFFILILGVEVGL